MPRKDGNRWHRAYSVLRRHGMNDQKAQDATNELFNEGVIASDEKPKRNGS